jgi:hypothetical protein
MSPEVEMRAIRSTDCPECRDGWVYAAPWEAWLSRRDDAEADWLAEHGSLADFTTASELLEERPDVDEDVECPTCAGRSGSYRRQAHAA